MNAIMTFASAADQMQRYDATRRRSAEQAYDRQAAYNGRHQRALADLEALLLGKKETEARQEAQQFLKLDAGQMKQIVPPLGKTLEETIDLWREVRREANSVPEQTTADQQLAATASAKIRETEARLALQKKAETEWTEVTQQERDAAIMTSPSAMQGSFKVSVERQFAKAISAYSIQVEAKSRGYGLEGPQYYVSA
ncbi:putative PilT family ATPase [Sporosarcina luteola]|nr:putative PilT family ATPase [Sporosarcina luteola]